MPTSDDRFTNEPIPAEGLPRLAPADFVAVERRYALGWLAVLIALAAVAATVGTVVAVTQGSAVAAWLTAAAVALLAAAGGWWVLAVRRLGYQVRTHDVSLRRGVITQRVETIPFVRVQHVAVRRGPFDRVLGLAALSVSSAGPDLWVPGLALDQAERIKALITERAGVEDDGSAPDGPAPTVWAAPTGPPA